MNDFIISTEDPDYEPSAFGLGYEYFHSLRKNSKKIAQYLPDDNLRDTYGALLSRSIRTALKLQTLGVTQDDVIALCSHHQLNTCVPFIAAQLLGNKIATLDPSISKTDANHLLNLVKPRIIFISPQCLPLIEDFEDMIVVVFDSTSGSHHSFDEFLEENPNEDHFQPAIVKSNLQTAVIAFSSGTSGLPKGIRLSHYALLGQIVQSFKMWNINEKCSLSNYKVSDIESSVKTVFLSYTSLYWLTGIAFLNRSLLSGSARVLCKEFQKENWWKLVEQYKVTMVFLQPTQIAEILSVKPKSPQVDSLNVILTGSSFVSERLMCDLFDTFPNAIPTQAYGQTEASGLITGFNCSDEKMVKMQKAKPQSCGMIVQGFKAKVVDPESGVALPPNQRGELRLKSKFLTSGYYNLDFSAAFDEHGWYKTGDIVYYDEDLCFYLVDRIKEMFKYKSWHIIPTILENILYNHKDVKKCAVIGIPHDIDGDHPMGLVVLQEGSHATTEELEKFVEDRVEERQRLRAGVRFVQNIPETITGKINRRYARNMIIQSF